MITRRDFLLRSGLAVASAALGCDLKPANRPNFVIILADDLGYGDLGCYGHSDIKTPNIDALAAGGQKWTDFHSNGPICSPTRAALLTGRYQQRCGIEGVVSAKDHRHTGMALSEITFAELLRDAGYQTGLYGKWHVGYPPDFNPVHQGFDDYRGFVSGNIDYFSHVDQAMYPDWWNGDQMRDEPGYLTDLITGHGVRFIEHNKDKPFCLYLAHGAPHYPYQGPGDTVFRHAGSSRPDESVDNLPHRYMQMMKSLDDGVGRITSILRKHGIDRDTLVFFFSDNGPARGALPFASAGPFRGHKGTLWEGGHRVPAIAYWPGRIAAGSSSTETGMGMDLLVTMAALAALKLPEQRVFDGVDLSPVFLGDGTLPERTLYWRFRENKAMRQGDWKFHWDGQRPGLYHLTEDISEENEVSQSHSSRVEEYIAMIGAWERDVTRDVTFIS